MENLLTKPGTVENSQDRMMSENESAHLFLCNCYDYLQDKADAVKVRKPNLHEIIRLTLIEINEDIEILEKQIELNK